MGSIAMKGIVSILLVMFEPPLLTLLVSIADTCWKLTHLISHPPLSPPSILLPVFTHCSTHSACTTQVLVLDSLSLADIRTSC